MVDEGFSAKNLSLLTVMPIILIAFYSMDKSNWTTFFLFNVEPRADVFDLQHAKIGVVVV